MRVVICLLALTTLVAGCASTVSGSARPVAGSPPPSNDATKPADNYGAPKVSSQLDTTKYQANPCAALTPAQLAGLGVTQPTTVEHDPKGNVCHISPQLDVEYVLTFNTAFDPGTAKGLANAYQIAAPGSLRRLPDIDGQPAVTQPSQNTNGDCTIYLGATDDISYAASVGIGVMLPHYDDPCSVAQQIAQDATTTMKSGG